MNILPYDVVVPNICCRGYLTVTVAEPWRFITLLVVDLGKFGLYDIDCYRLCGFADVIVGLAVM